MLLMKCMHMLCINCFKQQEMPCECPNTDFQLVIATSAEDRDKNWAPGIDYVFG